MITDEMFMRQKRFLESQMHKYPSDKRLLHLVFCTHLAHEVHEVMDCVPWKFHRAQQLSTRQELVEEIVDCQKLLINVMLLHGITQEEFIAGFDRKSTIVEERSDA